jgi:hypothetical protein
VGAVLAVGEHTPIVTFRPRDNEDNPQVQTAVTLSVVMAQPTISWNPPATISAGKALSEEELNATASVPGTFRYKPSLGEILPVGKHTLTVTFTPTDTMNYEPIKAAVPLAVAELAKVEINWPAPNAIQYGTPLNEAQLNATASVPGTFSYGPAAGNVLPPGKHSLVAVFTPDNLYTYAGASTSVTLRVDALLDVTSLLTAHIQGPIGREVAEQSIPEINEQVMRSSAPVQRMSDVAERAQVKEPVVVMPQPHETRIYKGVTYEKGDDGQWHRLLR